MHQSHPRFACRVGLVFPRRPEELRKVILDVLEDASNELPGLVRLALERAHGHWLELDAQLAWCNEQIDSHLRTDARAKKAAQLHGIGAVTASAIVAGVGEFSQFRNARQFGAWLGLVPSQNSSGGKTSLGGITKRGDDYLRTLLIQGAKAAVMTASKRTDRLSRWLVQLRERAGWQEAVAARANKNARIPWTIMTRDTTFDPDHVPAIPAARVRPAQVRLPRITDTLLQLRRAFGDAHHRLDRQQVHSSLGPWQVRLTTSFEWSPAARFVSGAPAIGRHKPACRCAV